MMSGLQQVAAAEERRAADGEGGHGRGLDVCDRGAGASEAAVGLAVPAMYALIAGRSVSSTWIVGTKWKSALSEFGDGVAEDHPDAAGLLDREALVGAGVDAALAEHDLAGDLRRVERAG